MPKNWKDFLRVDQNKTELFTFLSQKVVHLPLADGKELYASDGSGVLCSPAESNLARLAPCLQEEADYSSRCCAKGVYKDYYMNR